MSPLRRIAVAISVAIAAAMPAHAQDLGQQISPVLVLDSERLFRATRLGQGVSARMEEQIAALAAENRRIEAELAAEERQLTEDRPSMDPDAFRELADDFDARVQQIRDEQDAKQRELQALQEEEQQNFFAAVTPILSELGNRFGAVVILERRNVLLSADGIDITDRAIALINERLAPEEDAPRE